MKRMKGSRELADLTETARDFEIDPTKPLAEEFARVAAERDAFEADNIAAARALLKAGGTI